MKSTRSAGRQQRTTVAWKGIVILLGITSCALAGNGPGVAFKVGVQTFESPVSLEDTTRTRYEMELASQLFANDRLDFALSVGGSSLGEHKDADSGVFEDGAVWELYSTDEMSLIDIRLAARCPLSTFPSPRDS